MISITRTVSAGGLAGRAATWYIRLLSRADAGRDRVHVISDIVAHDRNPSLLDPRAVLRRVLTRLAALGYTAKVGVELEFYLLNPDGFPFQRDIHAYSLEN